MIGLALVTLVAVLAAGITLDVHGRRRRHLDGADYAITAQNNFSPIPIAAAEAAAKAPGVEAVANVRAGEAQVFGKTIFVDRRQPGGRVASFNLDWKDGSQAVLADARRGRRVRRRGLRRRPRPDASARRSRSDVRRPARRLQLDGQGHLRPARRRLAVRQRHDLERDLRRALRRSRRTSTRSCTCEGGADRREHRGARAARSTDVPEREGADAARSSRTTRSRASTSS